MKVSSNSLDVNFFFLSYPSQHSFFSDAGFKTPFLVETWPYWNFREGLNKEARKINSVTVFTFDLVISIH